MSPRLTVALVLAVALAAPARAGFLDKLTDKVADKVVHKGEQAANETVDGALDPKSKPPKDDRPAEASAPASARAADRGGSAAQRPDGAPGEIPGWTDTDSRPACKLLTDAEVQAVTGERRYAANPYGDAPGQGVGGGSSCNYGGPTLTGEGPPLLSVVLVPQGSRGRYYDARRGAKLAPGCKREPVAGVGKEAFFESCPAQLDVPLFVKGGGEDLIVALRMEDKRADASAAKRTIVAVARAAAPKLR